MILFLLRIVRTRAAAFHHKRAGGAGESVPNVGTTLLAVDTVATAWRKICVGAIVYAAAFRIVWLISL